MAKEIEAAAAALKAGLSREALVRKIQRREVRGRREGRFYLVDAEDLARLIREREAQGAPAAV